MSIRSILDYSKRRLPVLVSSRRSHRRGGRANTGLGRLAPTTATFAAWLVFAALLAGIPGAASAQTDQILVSNHGGADADTVTSMQAQAFTTGTNLHDYLLTSIDVLLGADQTGTSGMRVQVLPRGDDDTPDDGDPSRAITLSNPASFTPKAANTFTAPADTQLDANTEYFVLITGADGTGDPQYALAQTDSTEEGNNRAAGWSIGNARLWRASSAHSWKRVANNVVKIRVNGQILGGSGDPVVTVEADQPSIVAGQDDASFTLTRTGPTTDPLTVEVKIEQDRNYLPASSLSNEVTIPTGMTTATLEISASTLQRLPTGANVLRGTLTVSAVDTNDYDVVSASSANIDVFPLITVGIQMEAVEFEEAIGTLTVQLVALTGEGAPKPSTRSIFSLSTRSIGEATSPDDYVALSKFVSIYPGDYEADGSRYRASVPIEIQIADDGISEGDEEFGIRLEMTPGLQILNQGGYFVSATGQNCGSTCDYSVTIEGHFESDTKSVLVTNMSETSATGSSNNLHAQSFVTGPNLLGYVIGEVELFLRSSSSVSTSGTTFAAIKSDGGGSPGSTVANLTSPASFTDDAKNTFAAPTGTMLQPNTTYWLVVNGPVASAVDRAGVVTTASDSEDSFEDPPWAIGDSRLTRASSGDAWTSTADALKLEIVGTGAQIELTATAKIKKTSLSWTAPPASVLGYQIEVSHNGGATWWVLESDTKSTDTAYTHDASLMAGETRSYRVSAITAQGASPPSNEAVASATVFVSTLVATGLPAETVPRSFAVIDICWTLDGVALKTLSDISWAKRAPFPAGLTEWADRYWRPLALKPFHAPDCPAGTLGYRERSSIIPNLTYAFSMRARKGDMWLMSNDAEAVSVDPAKELAAYVLAEDSAFSIDTSIPATVCRDFDDPATAENEAGSFTVSVGFTTIPRSLGIYEPVAGFDTADDLTLVNATAQLVDQPYHYALGYRVQITPTTFGDPISVSVPADAVTHPDSAVGNQPSALFSRETADSDCHPSGEGLPMLYPPSVWRKDIADDTDDSGEWTHGERIQVTFDFYEQVVVATDGGRPTVALLLDGTDAEAQYAQGSGSSLLVFEYLVTAEQSPVNRVTVLANSLALNGGEITGIGGVEATLTHGNATKLIRPRPPLTAAWKNVPASHNGNTKFTLQLRFSEEIRTTYKKMRDKSISITGGIVESANRIDRRHDLWIITVRPTSTADITLTIASSGRCRTRNAVCTKNLWPLTNAATIVVPGP